MAPCSAYCLFSGQQWVMVVIIVYDIMANVSEHRPEMAVAIADNRELWGRFGVVFLEGSKHPKNSNNE